MNCPSCNTSLPDKAKYCTRCGAKLIFSDTSAQNFNSRQNCCQNCPPNYNPNYQQYSSPVNQKNDNGESLALASMIFGIVSVLLGPLFAIISLILIGVHNQKHKNKNEEQILIGKICSWFSIISAILLILFCILFLGGFFALLSSIPA